MSWSKGRLFTSLNRRLTPEGWGVVSALAIIIVVLGLTYAYFVSKKQDNPPMFASAITAIVTTERGWPPNGLYAEFDSTLAQGQIGQTGMIDGLTYNVGLELLNDMMAEYEFAGDLIPVTPIVICQEARNQFWPRFIRLEKIKTIMMDGAPVDARLRLVRRYGYLVNRGLDDIDQASRTGTNFPH
jgi:hypothetical protein